MRLADGQRADHESTETQVEQFTNRRFIAYSAAKLAFQLDGFENRGNGCEVSRLAVTGAIEIDKVEMPGPLIGPLRGDSRRIVAEDGFAIVIPLLEAHAFSSAQVNCRPDFHLWYLALGLIRR